MINKLYKRVRSAVRRRARYNTTVAELSRLSDRALGDLGISRGEIKFLAKKDAMMASRAF
jgi:uncharacterized protein YjiS (DUF1127 family)